MKAQKNILVLMLMLITQCLYGQLYWPLCNSSGCPPDEGNIIAGFNQPRGYGVSSIPLYNIHNAIDINGASGTGNENVYAPVSGTIVLFGFDNTNVFEKVEITDFSGNRIYELHHLAITPGTLVSGSIISAGDFIGKIGVGHWSTPHSHVHLACRDLVSPGVYKYIDPLGVYHAGGASVSMYADPLSIAPSFSDYDNDMNNNIIWFNKTNPTHEFSNGEPLFGKIQIIAEVADRQSNYVNPNPGPNNANFYQPPKKISYEVENLNKGVIEIPFRFLYDNALGLITHASGEIIDTDIGINKLIKNNDSLLQIKDDYLCDPMSTTCTSTGSPVKYNFNYIVSNANNSNNIETRRWATDVKDFLGIDVDGFQSSPPVHPVAMCPSESKFLDGEYKVKVKAEDYISDTTEEEIVIVDNFPPFVQQAELFIGSTKVYSKQWLCNGLGIDLVQNNDVNPYLAYETSPLAPLLVTVKSSEPLNNLMLDFSDFDSQLSNVVGTSSTDEMTWTFSMGSYFPNNFENLAGAIMKFSGQDLASNNLIELDGVTTAGGFILPKKTDINVWTPSYSTPNGYDATHVLGACITINDFTDNGDVYREYRFTGETCLLSDFSHQINNDGCTVEFNDLSIGTPSSWFWTFGDGASSEEQFPAHFYEENGCYTVNLTVSDTDGNTDAYAQQICITNCTDDGLPNDLECTIAGPEEASAGQLISLQGTGIGIGPFTYLWTVNGGAGSIIGASDEPTVQVQIDEDAVNDAVIIAYLEITDAIGNTCTTFNHSISVSGNLPFVNLSVFGSLQPNEYLYFSALIDAINITGTASYQFTVAGVSSDWQGGFGYELTSGLPAGTYTACVNVQDDVGVFADCLQFTIGGTPPNPSPLMSLLIADEGDATPNIIEADDPGVFIGYEGDHPHGGFASCELDPENINTNGEQQYVLDLTVEYMGSSLETEVYGELSTHPLGTEWTFSWAPNNCFEGTVAVTAIFYPAGCNDDYLSAYLSDEGYSVDPIYIDVIKGIPEITEIELTDGCDPLLEVQASGGCREASNSPCSGNQYYSNYEWRAYDINNPNQNIDLAYPDESFFDGDAHNKCITINKDHPYFEQFAPNDLVMVVIEIEIEDYAGFHQSYSKIVSIVPPMRINLPDEIRRCPGTITDLSLSPFVSGGEGPYTCQVLTGEHITFNENCMNATLDLSSFQVADDFEAIIEVDDANGCRVTKPFEVVYSEIIIESNPDLYSCYTGPSDNTLGAEIGGGSGTYTYQWSPGFYLDDPTDLNTGIDFWTNPLPVSDEELFSEAFTLLVTDEYGCTQTSDSVSVTIAQSEVVLEAGKSRNVCFGASTTLGSAISVDAPDAYYYWTSDNPHFDGAQGPQITLSEVVNSHPGTYVYTLHGVGIPSGCIYEDEVTITVLEPWLYTGYESTLNTILAGEEANLWEGIENYFLPESGHVLPLSYEWIPGAEDISNIGFNVNNIPREGIFSPTDDIPYLTLRVKDRRGCFKDFKSNRYLVLNAEPSLDIRSEQGIVACGEDEMCFDITFDMRYQGDGSSWLPSSVNVDCQFNIFSSNQNIDLYLTDGSGIYQGTICQNVSGPLQLDMAHILTVTLSGENEFFEGLTEDYVFLLGGGEAPLIDFVCGTPGGTSTNPNTLGFTGQAVDVVHVGKAGGDVPNCDNETKLNDDHLIRAGQTIIFHPDLGVVSQQFFSNGGLHSEGQLFVYIDPCLTEEEEFISNEDDTNALVRPEERPDVAKTEQTKYLDSGTSELKVYPNPFTGKINIKYKIEGQEGMTNVSLNLMDVTGSRITSLINNKAHENGDYTIAFDGSILALGIYFCELLVDNKQHVKKVVKLEFK